MAANIITYNTCTSNSATATGGWDTGWIDWSQLGDDTWGVVSVGPPVSSSLTWSDLCEQERQYLERQKDREHLINHDTKYRLPDGATLEVDKDGNYEIKDDDAQVIYKANRIREFSPHLNASDMVAEFMEYVHGLGLGIRREEVLQLPIQLFINWLIIEAAERDNDPIPEDIQPVPRQLLPIARPKCLSCGRFIKKIHQRHNFPFCDPGHAVCYCQRHLAN